MCGAGRRHCRNRARTIRGGWWWWYPAMNADRWTIRRLTIVVESFVPRQPWFVVVVVVVVAAVVVVPRTMTTMTPRTTGQSVRVNGNNECVTFVSLV